MNWIDIGIICILGLSVIVSIMRGLVREAFSLASWIIAVWVSIEFGADVAATVMSFISHKHVRLLASYVALFSVTLILGSLISYLLSQLVQKTGLSGTDRVLGAIFGAARGGLLIAVMVLCAGMTTYPQSKTWQASLLVPHFMPFASWLEGFFPESVKFNLPKEKK